MHIVVIDIFTCNYIIGFVSSLSFGCSKSRLRPDE